jgi:hypothetical protein
MAIVNVTNVTVKPGRYDDFLKQQRVTEALLKNAGAQNVRLVAGLVAGEASGSVAVSFEADDFKAHGKVMDAFFAGGGAELMQSISAEDSPIASWQSALYIDVPH